MLEGSSALLTPQIFPHLDLESIITVPCLAVIFSSKINGKTQKVKDFLQQLK